MCFGLGKYIIIIINAFDQQNSIWLIVAPWFQNEPTLWVSFSFLFLSWHMNRILVSLRLKLQLSEKHACSISLWPAIKAPPKS